MLDSGNCFDFDPAGNKVVKATGGLITLVNKNSASLTNCHFFNYYSWKSDTFSHSGLGKGISYL